MCGKEIAWWWFFNFACPIQCSLLSHLSFYCSHFWLILMFVLFFFVLWNINLFSLRKRIVFSRKPRSRIPLQFRVSIFFSHFFENLFLGFFSFWVSLSSVNVQCGTAEERVLLTGLHAVADIYCECCKTTLGWKYVSVSKNNSFQRVFFGT